MYFGCAEGGVRAQGEAAGEDGQEKDVKMFAAIAALIAGIIILLALPYNGFFWDHAPEALAGVLLLAAGATYFWKHSRFAK
jgi:hypothetical protein